MQIVDQQYRRKTNLTVFIVSAIITLLLLFFLLLPKYQEYQAKKQALNDAQKQLADINDTEKKVTLAGQQLSNDESDLQKVDLAIPSQENLPDLYAYIESLAKAANLKITSMQFVAPDQQAASTKPNTAVVNGLANTLNGTKTPNPDVSAAAAPAAKPVQKNLPAGISTTEIALQVTGDLPGFNQFMGSIEDSLRIMDVQSVDVSAVQERNLLSFKVTLHAYYQGSN